MGAGVVFRVPDVRVRAEWVRVSYSARPMSVCAPYGCACRTPRARRPFSESDAGTPARPVAARAIRARVDPIGRASSWRRVDRARITI